MIKVHGYGGTDVVGTRKKGQRHLKNIGPLIAKAFDVPMVCGSIGRARTWKGKMWAGIFATKGATNSNTPTALAILTIP